MLSDTTATRNQGFHDAADGDPATMTYVNADV